MSPRLDPQSCLAYSAVCLWSWPALDPREKPSLEYQSLSVLPSNSSSDGWARELHLCWGVFSPRRAPRAAGRSAGRQQTEQQADRVRRWGCIRGGFHELWEVRGQEYELDQNSERNKWRSSKVWVSQTHCGCIYSVITENKGLNANSEDVICLKGVKIQPQNPQTMRCKIKSINKMQQFESDATRLNRKLEEHLAARIKQLFIFLLHVQPNCAHVNWQQVTWS